MAPSPASVFWPMIASNPLQGVRFARYSIITMAKSANLNKYLPIILEVDGVSITSIVASDSELNQKLDSLLDAHVNSEHGCPSYDLENALLLSIKYYLNSIRLWQTLDRSHELVDCIVDSLGMTIVASEHINCNPPSASIQRELDRFIQSARYYTQLSELIFLSHHFFYNWYNPHDLLVIHDSILDSIRTYFTRDDSNSYASLMVKLGESSDPCLRSLGRHLMEYTDHPDGCGAIEILRSVIR